MICFRDITFCSADCLTYACHRNVTPAVKAAARAWWGGDDYPIALSDFSARCPDYTPAHDQGTTHD